MEIKEIALFGSLPPLGGCLEGYLDRGTCRKVFQGERISFDSADREEAVIYVGSGRLKLAASRHGASGLDFCFFGADTVLDRRNGGEGTGELFVQACENTVVYTFSRESFLQILQQDSRVLRAYTDFQAAQLSILLQRVEMTACLNADQRVVGWLIQLCRAVEPDGNVYEIPCPLTQQEIADYLFIHVTTFNRVFGDLKRRGLVEKHRGSFVIHDRKGLEMLLESLSA